MKDEGRNGYRTGCLGTLMPLALVAYALCYIIGHYRHDRHKFRYRSPESIEGDGITALGIALFVHALGFGPYRRWPVLRYFLAGLGVIVFFAGLHRSATL